MARMRRTKESYRGKTKAAHEAQLDALARGREKAAENRRLKRLGMEKPEPPKPKATRKGEVPALTEIDVIEFARSPRFLGLSLSPAQETVLRALYGLSIPPHLMPVYQKLTGNREVYQPDIEKHELVCVAGRRGGKSRLACIILLFEAICRGHVWRERMEPGEKCYFIAIAQREKSAADIIGAGVERMLANAGDALNGVIKNSLRQEIELEGGVVIAAFPTNSTASRGLPCPVCVLDECAFYALDGPRADEAVYNAIRPGQAQFGSAAKMLMISSPLARDGLLWTKYREGGQVPGRLTVKADTRTLNPLVPQAFIDAEYARDPDAAAREYGAEFCERVEGLFGESMLENAMTLVGDQAYQSGNTYFAGLDASGLAGRDRTGFGIAHRAGRDGGIILDACRSWESTDADYIYGGEVAQLVRAYSIRKVYIDRFAAGFVGSLLQKLGLTVEIRPHASQVMLTLKSLLIGGKVQLPMDRELKTGLIRTQLSISRASNPTIIRERGAYGHGDKADAAATACWAASQQIRKSAGVL